MNVIGGLDALGSLRYSVFIFNPEEVENLS